MPFSDDYIMTSRDVADYLQVSIKTARTLMSEQLPCFSITKHNGRRRTLRVRYAAVLEWVTERENKTNNTNSTILINASTAEYLRRINF